MTSEADAAGGYRLAGEEAFDLAAIDAILDALLGADPQPYVIALNDSGLAVAMPVSVPVTAAKSIDGVGSALDVCLPREVPGVIAIWERALRTGGAHLPVRLRSEPDRTVTLHFVDARHRYGVLLGIFVGNAGRVIGAEAVGSLFRPRLCTLRRDELGVIHGADHAATKILGWTHAELMGTRALDLLHPDDRSEAIAHWLEMLARPGSDQRGLVRYRHRDGRYLWIESTHHNRLGDPTVGCVVTEMVDVGERMEAVEALRASEELLRRLTEALPVGILQIDTARRIAHVNERLGEILGTGGAGTADELFGLVAPDDRKTLDTAFSTVLASGTPAEIELSVDLSDGARRCSVAIRALTAENGNVTGAIACVSDTTERVRLREELERRATVDTLTRCRNRAAILEILESALDAPASREIGIAVLFIDLDRFKEINDRLGHAAGDELLRRVGDRLLHGARAGDVVGRLGGDEFLVVCPDVAAPQTALEIARRITIALAQRTIVGAHAIVPTASIGVAWTNRAVDADTLVANADSAMYEAKRRAAGPLLFRAANGA